MDIWITDVKSCESVLTKIQPKFNKSGQRAHHLDLPNRIRSFVDRLIIGWSAFSNANWPIRCNSLRQCTCLTETTHGVSSSCNISFVAMMISWSFWVCCSVSRPFYGLLSSSSHSELWLLSTFVPYGSDIQIIWQQTQLSTGNRPNLSNSLHDSATWERFLNSPVRSLLECKLAWLSCESVTPSNLRAMHFLEVLNLHACSRGPKVKASWNSMRQSQLQDSFPREFKFGLRAIGNMS
jgi:hypothetical protein